MSWVAESTLHSCDGCTTQSLSDLPAISIIHCTSSPATSFISVPVQNCRWVAAKSHNTQFSKEPFMQHQTTEIFFFPDFLQWQMSSAANSLLNIKSLSNLATHFLFQCNYAAFEQLDPRSDLPCSLLNSCTISDVSTAVASSGWEANLIKTPNSKMWIFTSKSL